MAKKKELKAEIERLTEENIMLRKKIESFNEKAECVNTSKKPKYKSKLLRWLFEN